jgi:hypothetical protein
MRTTQVIAVMVLASVSIVSEERSRYASPGARPESATPREIVLNPSPTGQPVIGPALNAALPGSVIHLQRGVYHEIVTISKPVSLVGEEGAVIDASEPFRAKWEPVGSFGGGVYRARVDRAPASLIINGKILAHVNPEREETIGEGRWNWKRLLSSGPPRTGFRFIRGVWLYRSDEKAIFVHLENDVDPSVRNWSVVWSQEPIVTLRNTRDASARQLTLAYGYHGIAITENCLRCSVTGSKIGPWEMNGVMVRNGAAESLVERNEIFRGSYEDLTPVTISEPGSGLSISRDWYEVWQVHKLAGFWDRVGISVTLSGHGNRIHANRIHDVFDGIDLGEGEIESLDAPVADPGHDEGTEIWENDIERTGDSGIEVGGPAVNVKIHHNILRQSHGNLRYKLPRMGPIFIYRNVLIDGSPYDIWYSMDDSPAEGYVYHNTVVGGQVGLAYHGWRKHHNIGAPRWHYLNNLIMAKRGFFETRDPAIPINFTVDYNVVMGGGRPYPCDPTKDSHSRYVDEIKMAPGFPPMPLPGSPAIDAGLDLSTYFHGKPLPGCAPGYFKGKAPDAGAYEIE